MRRLSATSLSGADYFAPAPLGDIKQATVRGGTVVLVAQAAKFVLAVLTVAIMARILTPSDYGVFALLMIVVSFIAVLGDFGLSSATIQRTTLTHHEASSLYWVNIVAGCALALACVAVSPLVAMIFHQSKVVLALSVMGVSFLVSAVGAQHSALLSRVMRFGRVAVCLIGAQVLSSLTGIALALAGAGYWSLVILQMTYTLVNSLLLSLLSGWKPARPKRPLLVRELLHFGARVTGFSVANYVARNMDNILIGKVYGLNALGNYSRAYNMLLAPLEQVMYPIANVMIAALSRIGIIEREAFRRTFMSVATKINLAVMPLVAFAVVDSQSIIRVALGDQWGSAAKIFAVLGIGGLVEPVIVMTSWLFMSEDRTREYLVLGVVGVPVMVCAFFAGLPYGPVGVAAGYTIVTCAGVVPTFWYTGREGPVSAGDLYRTCVLGAEVAVAVAAGALLSREALVTGDALLSLVASAGVAACAGCVALAALPAARREVRELRAMALEALRGRRRRASV